MPDAYITRAELLGEMPQEDIERALDDGGSADLESVWDALSQSVADEIHGFLAPRYHYPFDAPFQPTIKAAARTLTLFRLYKRRGVSGDANPMKEEAEAVRLHLRQIGTGKVLLDAASPQPATPAAGKGPVAVTGTGSVASRTTGRMPL